MADLARWMMPGRALTIPEDREQQTVVEWAQAKRRRWMLCEAENLSVVDLLFHVPNGGWRHKRTAGVLKRTGAKAGVPDLWLPVPRGRYLGLVIEMKSRIGTTTPEQRFWLSALERQRHPWADELRGWRAEVARGAAEGIEILEEYLDLPGCALVSDA